MKTQNDKFKYNIIMIQSTWKIDDINDAIKNLVKYLPVSIIIIGMGNSKFMKLKELDCDHYLLKNKEGTEVTIDIFQFVPFLKKKNNLEKLAEEFFLKFLTKF